MDKLNTIVYGGSFDPPHKGHLELVKYVLDKIIVDKVIIMPCYIQPLKDNIPLDSIHRYNMLKLLFKDLNIEISKYEIEKKETSYTIDTLKYFNTDAFLLGLDSFKSIKQWKSYEELLSLTSLIVVSRGKDQIEEVLYKLFDLYSISTISENLFRIDIENYKPIYFLDGFYNDISSNDIRSKLYKREKTDSLTDEVEQYIENNRLYLKNV